MPEPRRGEPRPAAAPDPALPVAAAAAAGVVPRAGGSPSRTVYTKPVDVPVAFPPGPAPPGRGRTWHSTARPQDRPGPDGGVHHDVTPRMPGAAELATPVALPQQRPRRARVLAVVALVAVFGAGGTAGALALHRHYAAGITSPGRPAAVHPAEPVASASPASSATPGTHSATPRPVSSSGWSSPFPVPQLHGGAVVSGISCPTATVCYAVDSAGAILSSTPPGGWRKVGADSAGGLVAVSCATMSSCVAVDHSGNALVLAHGTWGAPAIVDTGSGAFTALSCPTPTFCMSTDSSGAAYADTSTGWQQFTVDTSGGKLTGVSCTSAKYCVAVDDGGGVYTFDGTAWSAVSAIDAGHAFTAVSCATRSFCAAVDQSGNVATFSAGKWTVAPLGTTALTVSCPVSGFCVATDGAGGAMVYRGGAWSRASVVDGKAVIGALSCASPTFCVAIDHSGGFIYYRPE